MAARTQRETFNDLNQFSKQQVLGRFYEYLANVPEDCRTLAEGNARVREIRKKFLEIMQHVEQADANIQNIVIVQRPTLINILAPYNDEAIGVFKAVRDAVRSSLINDNPKAWEAGCALVKWAHEHPPSNEPPADAIGATVNVAALQARVAQLEKELAEKTQEAQELEEECLDIGARLKQIRRLTGW